MAALLIAGSGVAQERTTRLANLVLKENTQTWTLRAHSAQDIDAELRRHGLIGARESERRSPYVWQLSWSVRGKPGTKVGCSVDALEVKLTTITTQPSWAPPRGTPAPVIADWQRFEAALHAHVMQHRNLTVNRMSQLRPRLLKLTAQDCAALERGVGYIAEGWIEDVRRLNAEYDRRTQHGATENVRWPPGPAARRNATPGPR